MEKFDEIRKVHFIGIGGVSVSALATLCLKRGIIVTGSDREYSERMLNLSLSGCEVWVGSEPERIVGVDLVVYSGAVKRNDPEYAYCVERGIKVMERSAFLSLVASYFKCVIAVAGTHGKTTVTSLIAKILIEANLPCCCHIGGDAVGIGNMHYSGDEYFLTEACEYRKSLLFLDPDIGIVLNAEYDHPDTYRDLSEVYDTFDTYLSRSRSKGLSLVCGDEKYYALRQSINENMTFGKTEKNRFRAEKIREYRKGYYEFEVTDYGNPLFTVRLPIPGIHNINNALCAIAVGVILRIPFEAIKSAVKNFGGVGRRFEKTSVYFGATVYSDYAHHPDEIKASIATAKEILKENKRLVCVFQPHTFSRTAKLFDEFATCFDVDEIIILKEYPARETPADGKSALELYRALPNTNKRYYDNIIDVAAYITNSVRPDDIVLILGAGDIDNLTYLLGKEK